MPIRITGINSVEFSKSLIKTKMKSQTQLNSMQFLQFDRVRSWEICWSGQQRAWGLISLISPRQQRSLTKSLRKKSCRNERWEMRGVIWGGGEGGGWGWDENCGRLSRDRHSTFLAIILQWKQLWQLLLLCSCGSLTFCAHHQGIISDRESVSFCKEKIFLWNLYSDGLCNHLLCTAL